MAAAGADFVFCSRSRAATKFSKSMAVTTPNTICLLLDFPLLWSAGEQGSGFKGAPRGLDQRSPARTQALPALSSRARRAAAQSTQQHPRRPATKAAS